jgi:hypothetical protein
VRLFITDAGASRVVNKGGNPVDGGSLRVINLIEIKSARSRCVRRLTLFNKKSLQNVWSIQKKVVSLQCK